MDIVDYLEIVKGFIKTFEYWQELAILASGIVFGYLLRIITFRLRIFRIRQMNEYRNMVVIESQSRGNWRKNGGAASYIECIKNAQYSTEDWQRTKDMGKGIKLIK